MSGGGDTPKNTLWAYEYEHGNFVLGSLHNGVLKIECETDSADLWVVDAEGVYRDNIAMDSGLKSDIVDAINAKYDTDFTELTMMQVSGIAIGDDCPDWDTYEKIQMPQIEFVKYLNSGTGNYMAGHIDYENKKLKIWSQSNQQALVLFDSAGKWIAGGGNPAWNTDFLNAVIAKGINVVSAEFEDIPNMQPGDTIENWSDYVEV